LVLGDAFLKAHYTNYDLRNVRVGIAGSISNNPSDASDSSQPVDPNQPSQPVDPNQPSQPIGPSQPINSGSSSS